MMFLQIHGESGANAAVRIPGLPAVIGRGNEVDVRIDCRWASRRHCELDCIQGSIRLRDLGSRNGTLVNGTPVQESALSPGDEVTIGLNRYVLAMP